MEQFILLDDKYLPEMAQIFKAAFSGEPWNDNWSDEHQLMNYIKDLACAGNSLNYGFLTDGKLAAISIGSVRHWWEGINYNIDEFCVLPEMQGQNIGSRFLAMIEADIKAKGISGIFLQTDSDKPSYRFYQKNGFHEMTTHVSFYKSV